MKKSKRKFVFIGIIISFVLVGSLIYISSDDKKLDIDEVSSQKALLAIYLEDENGDYNLSDSNAFPTSGYSLNLEKSSCLNGGVLSQDSTTKKVSVQTSKADRCNLYFAKAASPASEVLAKLGVIPVAVTETVPNFAEPATTNEGIYSMEDDYGTSYFYRGAVTNNYVKFAGFYWRIIRINGNGSVRIIYDGTSAHANGENNADRYATTSAYSVNNGDAKYVGWMYGPAGENVSTSKEQAQTNTESATIKIIVDEWYKTNIVNKGFGNSIVDAVFCNDRSTPGKSATGWNDDTGLGYGTNNTAYGGYARLGVESINYNNVHPTFKCPQKNDAFTVGDTKKGNGALTYPVGLITADEIVAAGSGNYISTNSMYYLYNRNTWSWSLSPLMADDYSAAGFFLGIYGGISGNDLTSRGAIAPVINLSAEYFKTLIGTGSMENPFRTE